MCVSLSCTFKRPISCAIRKWANSLKRECRQQKSHCAALVALWTLVPVAVNGHHTWEFEIVERTECYFCHGPADSGRGEVRCMFFFSLVSPSITSPFCMWLLQLETSEIILLSANILLSLLSLLEIVLSMFYSHKFVSLLFGRHFSLMRSSFPFGNLELLMKQTKDATVKIRYNMM